MISVIALIFVFMLIIIARNKNNTFVWIFAGIFAALNIIFISMIFYIIKLSNYYPAFRIENTIFTKLSKINVNFFRIRTLVNIGVVAFVTAKLLFVRVMRPKIETRGYLAFLGLCFVLGALYMYFNSFRLVQQIFLLKNSSSAQDVRISNILSGAIKAYNISLLSVSMILPYVVLWRSYRSTALSFKKKQYNVLVIVHALVDVFFIWTFVFGFFKGRVINNIALEELALYQGDHTSSYFVYFSVIMLLAINIIYIFMVRYRVFDSVNFLRNRVILKNIKVLPADIRNVTHSYKNSLFSIMTICDEMREEYGDDKKLGSMIDQIDAVSNGVLGQLEKFADLTNSNIRSVAEVDIQSCVDEAVQKLSLNKIKLEKNYYSVPKSILAERAQIVEAIYNLLVNSVEAIESTGRKDGKIKISLYSDVDWVCISIWDNGCGIEKKNIKKLYNPLFSTKKTNKNWGIGLSYTYKVIKAHLGIIFCKSVHGEYTEFQILLTCQYGNNSIW